MPNYVVDVTLDGVAYSYTQGTQPDPAAGTWLEDGIRIGWRRSPVRRQPEPMTCSLSLVTTMDAEAAGVGRARPIVVQVWADELRTDKIASFYGRQNDPTAAPVKVGDPATTALRYTFTAVDYLADLVNYTGVLPAGFPYEFWTNFTGGFYWDPADSIYQLRGALLAAGRFPGFMVPTTQTEGGTSDGFFECRPVPDLPVDNFEVDKRLAADEAVVAMAELSTTWAADDSFDYPFTYPDVGHIVTEPWVDPATGQPWTSDIHNYGLVLCPILDTRVPSWWTPPYQLAVAAGVVVLDRSGPTPSGTWVVPGCDTDTGVGWQSMNQSTPTRVAVTYVDTATGKERIQRRNRLAPHDGNTLHIDGRQLRTDDPDWPNPAQTLADSWLPDIGVVPGSTWTADKFTVRADRVPGLLTGAPWIPDHAVKESQEAVYPTEIDRTAHGQPPGHYRRHACYEAPVIVEDIDPGWHPDGHTRYVGQLLSVDLVLAGGHTDVTFSLARRDPLAFYPDGSGHAVQAISYADVLADVALGPTTYPAWAGVTIQDARLARY